MPSFKVRALVNGKRQSLTTITVTEGGHDQPADDVERASVGSEEFVGPGALAVPGRLGVDVNPDLWAKLIADVQTTREVMKTGGSPLGWPTADRARLGRFGSIEELFGPLGLGRDMRTADEGDEGTFGFEGATNAATGGLLLVAN